VEEEQKKEERRRKRRRRRTEGGDERKEEEEEEKRRKKEKHFLTLIINTKVHKVTNIVDINFKTYIYFYTYGIKVEQFSYTKAVNLRTYYTSRSSVAV
jgi:hypothetical protein